MVAHDMDIVMELCGRAAWLEHGKIRSLGPASEVVRDYRAG